MAWYSWLMIGIVVINLPTILRSFSRRKPAERGARIDLGWMGDPRSGAVEEVEEVGPSSLEVDLEGPGDFDLDVVGESHYQLNLMMLTGGKTPDGVDVVGMATLVLEDGNPHDPKAVRVDMNTLTVGYLGREDARAYRRRLKREGRPEANLTCRARIGGGWKRARGDEGHFGVKLDLETRG